MRRRVDRANLAQRTLRTILKQSIRSLVLCAAVQASVRLSAGPCGRLSLCPAVCLPVRSAPCAAVRLSGSQAVRPCIEQLRYLFVCGALVSVVFVERWMLDGRLWVVDGSTGKVDDGW